MLYGVQAAWVAGQYADIKFSDQNNFRKAFHCVVFGLNDPELPVRVDSVFALQFFIEACKGGFLFTYSLYFYNSFYGITCNYVVYAELNEILPILPQLLDGRQKVKFIL